MNKITHTLTVSAIAVLVLAGCSAAPAAETVTAPVEETPAAETTPEPLTVDPEAEAVAAGDEMFLTETRLRFKSITDATDEQLIAAGHEACELFTQGQTKMDMRLIEGETPDSDTGWFWDSIVISTWAATAYCPEFEEVS
jgi:hypothetical protein